MKNALNKLLDKIYGWGESLILMAPNIALAIIVAVAMFFITKYSKRLFSRLLKKASNNEAVNKLFANIFASLVAFIGLFLVLSILDLSKTVTSLLAGAGVVGLAVGLAFQDPILNVMSGVIMSIREPFNIGDTIQTNGYFGTIQRITLRSTHLKKFTGEDIIIPNKMVLQNPIENYTLTRYRRVDIPIGVSYSDDLQKAEEVAKKAIQQNVDYDTSREVEVYYDSFGDSSINFNLRYWLDMAAQKDFLKAKSDGIKAIKSAFDKNGISIPFPMRTLEFGSKLQLEKFSMQNTNGKSKLESNGEYRKN